MPSLHAVPVGGELLWLPRMILVGQSRLREDENIKHLWALLGLGHIPASQPSASQRFVAYV